MQHRYTSPYSIVRTPARLPACAAATAQAQRSSAGAPRAGVGAWDAVDRLATLERLALTLISRIIRAYTRYSVHMKWAVSESNIIEWRLT